MACPISEFDQLTPKQSSVIWQTNLASSRIASFMHNIYNFRGSTLTMANDLFSKAMQDRRLGLVLSLLQLSVYYSRCEGRIDCVLRDVMGFCCFSSNHIFGHIEDNAGPCFFCGFWAHR